MKLLSDFHWKSTSSHRAVLTCDVTVDLEEGYTGYHEFCHDNNLWGILRGDKLTIMAGYASDLCSPGFCLFGRWYGTPSRGDELAAILHDFTRQFMAPNLECSPWKREDTDRIFYNSLSRGRRSLYHGAVAGPLGSLWIWLNKPRPDVYCRCIHK